jgi:hypothetical protein
MYKAFNVSKLSFGNQKRQLIEYSEGHIIGEHRNVFEQKIEYFKNTKTGRLNSTKLTADWFPQIDADIFISHSHQDYEDVVALAGWLYEKFGIIAFIDECLWGFCENLLRLIDNRYCMTPDSEYYDYQKRNHSTSHVYMMLTASLFDMIDRTQCLFFYNTPNSIIPKDIFSSTEQTLSPWIFTEIEMTKLVRTRTPEEHRQMQKAMIESTEHYFSREELKIEYDVDLSHLITIDTDFMCNWAKQSGNGDKDFALNYLYEHTGNIDFLSRLM